MKGGLAAAVFAAKAIIDNKIETAGDVILMLSAGEESGEGGMIGVKACVDRGYTAPFAIVCEPSGLELHSASVSALCFDLIVYGKTIHVCNRNQVMFPQSSHQMSGEAIGVDAVEKALPLIHFFYRLEKEWNHRYNGKSAVGTGGIGGHDMQGVGVFCINPSFIKSGTMLGAVPGEVKITYAIWHPPEVSHDEMLSEIREKVALLAQTDAWLKENPPEIIGPLFPWRGFVTDDTIAPAEQFKRSFKDVMSAPPVVTGMRCTCDATYLFERDIPVVVCGPGKLSDGAHGCDEFVSRDDVLNAAKIYASFIFDWCK